MRSVETLAVIELTGPRGVGKTTLAALFIQELAPASLLYVDASPEHRLTDLLAPAPPRQTLGDVARHLGETAGMKREAVDWLFSDLAVPVGEEGDLIEAGQLPDTLPPMVQDHFCYGLSRLMRSYRYVVVDGFHPVIHSCLAPELLKTLIVLTPDTARHFEWPEDTYGTPAVIFNHDGQQIDLPPQLETALREGRLNLIGKLPHYERPEDCIRNLPEDFHNCLLKLDIPMVRG